ncbi:16S rRNA (uracil(1498)-N(3))-methyltransferase [Phytohalomonas tamaricis]|uniref:16S rRNA (uracil(1498)-N(3))-methyltransferase n=1 Tax=Phytohalomonas tamaricis TaxID=2081032 RepID=UPI000D0AE291|nr:16S rRNA (uracil(1498)-N(3))-methyltransferase [Phytohalomonas tamaricis]
MNLILLSEQDLTDAHHASITDPRRLRHLHEVHRAALGDAFTVGLEGGNMGRGQLTRLDADRADFELQLDLPPPAALPLHLLLALPRPRMLARTLENIAALGVKRLTLMHTQRVEKSYWQSPELSPASIREHLVLGLEQARDTIMPHVDFATRFKPFIEDQLPELIRDRHALLAHPGMAQACPYDISAQQPREVVLAIGPEGGFIPYEVDHLLAAGFEGVHLGARILRVETAVVALLARLF